MKVSILMVTYNHEEFIAKALDSILMQRTNFEYEIVIGEDCSTDNTRNIIIGYKERYPDKFKLLLNDTNIGMHRNGAQTWQACTGEYIAILEGDDYWTSADKLQKQVDFLDNNPECVICFHNVTEIYIDCSRESHNFISKKWKDFYTIDDLFIGNFMPSPSIMYRGGLVKEIPEWFSTLKLGDWPLHILHALHGTIGYIDETMAVHVNHQGGVWSTMNYAERYKAMLPVYDYLYVRLGHKYRKQLALKSHELNTRIAECYEDIDMFHEAKYYVHKSMLDHHIVSKKSSKMLIRLYLPRLYKIIKQMKYVNS